MAFALTGVVTAFAACGSARADVNLPWSPPTIDPANFVSKVTNPYLPLVPGT